MSKLQIPVRTAVTLAFTGVLTLIVVGRDGLSPQLQIPAVAAPAAAQQAAALPAVAQQASASNAARTISKRAQRAREEREGDGAEARERRFEERERKYGPRPDHPGEAIAFRRLSLIDENGYIPPDGLMKAKQHVDMMRANRASLPAPTAGLSRAAWTWKGPGNIGGRTRALAINPSNTSVIFAGTVGGGIWKTTNGGTSWSVVDDFMANLAVTSILYQPGSTSIMYAGTGEGFWNGDAIRGAGIFKSIDGGTTWTQLSSTANSNFYYVNRLAMSPDGSILLAATRSGLFKSIDGGVSFNFSGTAPTSGATDVKFLPGSNTMAVASGYNGTAYYSTNGGTSWSPSSLALGGSFTRVELAVSPSMPANVYAVVDHATINSGRLYKSTNNGVSYSLVSTPGHLGQQGWYDNVIWVDPTNDNNLVVGGIDLYRSTNGGVNFTNVSSWQFAPASAHADHHAIVNDPGYNGTTNRRVYFGNDGGVYKAEDVMAVQNGPTSTGWTSLNNSFGPTQFYGAAGHAATGRITGGTQDNGDLFLGTGLGTSSWVDRFGGDGGFSAYDPVDANTFYGEYVFLTVHRNTSGGGAFSQDIWGPTDVNWNACKAAPYRIDDACAEMILGFSGTGAANFIAPFILDPNNANTMLAGGLTLWRTNDVKTANTPSTGPTWTAIKAPLGSSCGTFCINAIAVAPGNSALIYVGYNSGDVYMTTNGTAATPTWNKVDSGSMPNSQVQRIAIDPNNNNSVWVAFGGYATNNLWHSSNGASAAATWALSTGSGGTALPAAPIRGIAIHPTTANTIYVGTEVGVFASGDGGATWGVNDGPANVSVDELSWMGTTLIAATHGRGVWTTTPNQTITSDISIDAPANGSTVAMPITVSGWAINRGASSGTGVDAVHIYLTPAGGAATFLGAATYGSARSDIGAIYGSQFTNSGYTFTGGSGFAAGAYTVTAFAHNATTGTFDAAASVNITVGTPTGNPQIGVDTPTANQVVTSSFEIGGWLLDANAPSGTGVDDVKIYVQLPGAPAPGVFIGHGRLGLSRPDVGAIYGSRFNNAGFHFTITGLSPGPATLWVIGHSTVTSSDSISKAVPYTVSATGLMSVDVPTSESIITANTFSVGGWAIDRSVEGTAQAGTGIDSVVVYAFHNPGSGEPAVFLGEASYGIARSDVAAFYGSRYTNSGYGFIVDRAAAGLGTGEYNIVPIAHNTITNTYSNLAIVRVVLQ